MQGRRPVALIGSLRANEELPRQRSRLQAACRRMWPSPPSRSGACRARLLVAATLAAALLAARCSGQGEQNDSAVAAAGAAAATRTAAPLQAKDEQDLLKWALCEWEFIYSAAPASTHGHGQTCSSGRRRRRAAPAWPAATAAQPLAAPALLAHLLRPAAAHSDPDALKAAAAEARAAAEAGSPEFRERQQRVQALLDAMRGEPTEGELMQARPAGAAAFARQHLRSWGCTGHHLLLLGWRRMRAWAASQSCPRRPLRSVPAACPPSTLRLLPHTASTPTGRAAALYSFLTLS